MPKIKGTKIKLEFTVPEEDSPWKKEMMAAFTKFMKLLGEDPRIPKK